MWVHAKPNCWRLKLPEGGRVTVYCADESPDRWWWIRFGPDDRRVAESTRCYKTAAIAKGQAVWNHKARLKT